MNFYLLEQLQLHPSMQPEDVLKMTYQATFGAEHLLSDIDKARNYLHLEFAETKAEDLPLYEEISEEYSRLNIAAWKYQHRNEEEFFDLFISSLPKEKRTKQDFLSLLNENIKTLKSVWKQNQIDELTSLLKEMESNLGPVRHSEIYRKNEHPHYRIVRTKLIASK